MSSYGSLFSLWKRALCAVALLAISFPARAAERPLGDLDRDGQITVLDLARQIAHMKGESSLDEAEAAYADVNRDGTYSSLDTERIVSLILGTEKPEVLPPARILLTSPAAGESGVSVTREFVVRFSMPLALDAVVATHNPNSGSAGNLYAEFGGRRLLTRVELSSDRRKATLFFLEPVPTSARIRVTFDPTGLNDLLGRGVDGDGDGASGGVSTFEYDTLGIAPVANTAVIGTVYGVQVGTSPTTPVPLAGVTITVDGAEQTLRTTTGTDGKFVLSPAPAGRFFVLIDGRTATASGPAGYYAFVGKAWEGAAGKSDTPATPATDTTAAGDIYLPFIAADTLKPVSTTTETVVPFSAAVLRANPELEGVQIMVPPNALFANNGARGGSVGIAPVSPDKLPEPLPTGLRFPLVITIQTDGATNFDRPVPVRFPNLPDPVTGRKLGPGEKSALFSFNHETGTWEMAGSMTVSSDGRFVETDLGVGVRKPGWHGPGPFGGLGGDGDGPCLDTETGNNALALEKFQEAEDILKARELDLAKTLLVEAAGDALRFLDPLLKTKDCVEQSLNGAPNFFGTKSVFYMPKGCVDMAIEFLILPLEELKAAKIVTERAINLIKNAKAINEFSDFINDAATMKEKFEEANQLLALTVPCKPSGNSEDPRKGVNDAFADFKRASDAFVDATQKADECVRRLNEVDPRLTDLSGKGNPNDPTLGFTHEQQADLVTGLRGEAASWYYLVGPGGYFDIARRFLTTWTAYQSAFRGYASSGSVSIVGGRMNIGQPAPKRIVYMLEQGNTRQRLMKMNGGGYNFFVPAGAPATLWAYEIDQKWIAECGPFISPAAGSNINQTLHFKPQGAGAVDTDGDGLSDLAEFIVGSDPTRSDTNRDGVSDAAALQAGLDPSNGTPNLTGIVANLPTLGEANVIASSGNLIAVANGDEGIDLFDGTDRGNPKRLGQVTLPAYIHSLALEGRWLVATQNSAGLAFIDVADPSAPKQAATVQFGHTTQAVALSAGIAVAGTSAGRVYTFDADTQTVISNVYLGANSMVQDIAVNGYYVYVLTTGSLYVLEMGDDASLVLRRQVSAPGAVTSSLSRQRLFVALDRLYATFMAGTNVYDIGTNPGAPALLRSNSSTSQVGFKQLVLATPTLGLFAAGNNTTADGPHNVQTYRITADGNLDINAPTSTLVTPGIARALTVVNGLAMVADSRSGMQVINYLATETGTTPPTVSLSASFPLTPTPQAQEGSRETLFVDARDDVQVRNVEFYINGVLTQNDGNFPFSFSFNTPKLSSTVTSFKLRAVAYDTAGNQTASPEINVGLTQDSRPPRVTRMSPGDGALVGSLNAVSASFNEAILASTATTSSIRLRNAGSDGIFGTLDDLSMVDGKIAVSGDGKRVSLSFVSALPAGLYRFEVTSTITDLVGNALEAAVSQRFIVIGGSDGDGDGVPDNAEAALGLDPRNPDTNGNGVNDGNEDFDNDGLTNAWEIAVQMNPSQRDSDGNSINDGDEDLDGDGLTNREEQVARTNPSATDTDGDGWNDEAELSGKGDPLDRTRIPAIPSYSMPLVRAVFPSASSEALPASFAVSRPSVTAAVSAVTSDLIKIGAVVSVPAVKAVFSSVDAELVVIGTVVSKPEVKAAFSSTNSELVEVGTVTSTPSVKAVFSAATSEEVLVGTVVSQPKVEAQFQTP